MADTEDRIGEALSHLGKHSPVDLRSKAAHDLPDLAKSPENRAHLMDHPEGLDLIVDLLRSDDSTVRPEEKTSCLMAVELLAADGRFTDRLARHHELIPSLASLSERNRVAQNERTLSSRILQQLGSRSGDKAVGYPTHTSGGGNVE